MTKRYTKKLRNMQYFCTTINGVTYCDSCYDFYEVKHKFPLMSLEEPTPYFDIYDDDGKLCRIYIPTRRVGSREKRTAFRGRWARTFEQIKAFENEGYTLVYGEKPYTGRVRKGGTKITISVDKRKTFEENILENLSGYEPRKTVVWGIHHIAEELGIFIYDVNIRDVDGRREARMPYPSTDEDGEFVEGNYFVNFG